MPQHKKTDSATVPYILALLGTTEQALQEQELAPQALAEIYNDYLARESELTDTARLIAAMLLKVEGVRYVNYRAKAPLHLLQKIIRKKKEYPDRIFNQHTYLDLINDLVGVRALHLYKELWIDTGRFIQQEWKLKRAPYAYINEGDEDEQLLQEFAAHGCRNIPHPTGYKAVHFVIETKPAKQRYFAEIQLRTLFEEGWSEIDHSIRYPNHDNSELLDHLLQLLNKFTSHADNTASLIQKLTFMLHTPNQKVSLQDKKHELAQLQSHIQKLPVEEADKRQLCKDIALALGVDQP
jgi:ppGpp synthetase/RelA/SpoT-type nucleotidyltranferase